MEEGSARRGLRQIQHGSVGLCQVEPLDRLLRWDEQVQSWMLCEKAGHGSLSEPPPELGTAELLRASSVLQHVAAPPPRPLGNIEPEPEHPYISPSPPSPLSPTCRRRSSRILIGLDGRLPTFPPSANDASQTTHTSRCSKKTMALNARSAHVHSPSFDGSPTAPPVRSVRTSASHAPV